MGSLMYGGESSAVSDDACKISCLEAIPSIVPKRGTRLCALKFALKVVRSVHDRDAPIANVLLLRTVKFDMLLPAGYCVPFTNGGLSLSVPLGAGVLYGNSLTHAQAMLHKLTG